MTIEKTKRSLREMTECAELIIIIPFIVVYLACNAYSEEDDDDR